MKKILFPTDFSFISLNAFRYALHLAQKIEAEIITLHVYDLPAGTYSDYHDFLTKNYNISDWNEFENCKSDVPKLRAIADELQLGNIQISHMLNRGNVVETILSVAADEHVDFIVMGTTGQSGLKEIFLGSNTENILSQATASVLAIPEYCHYKPIENILFLTKFKESQQKILKSLLGMAKLFDAHIDVLQVKSNHDKTEAEVLAKWKNAFPASNISFLMLSSDDFEETIIEFIETNQINIVVMQVHHKGFFEKLFGYSLSQRLTFHCEVPIMGIFQSAIFFK